MKVTLESTDKIVQLVDGRSGNATVARLWVGKTESGIEVQALIARIAAPKTENLEQFDRELKEQSAPQVAYPAFPLRMVI